MNPQNQRLLNNSALQNKENKRKIISANILSLIYGIGFGITLFALSSINNNAYAELKVVDNKPTSVVNGNVVSEDIVVTKGGNLVYQEDANAQKPKTFITQIGVNEQELKPLKGFANDMQLVDVLKQITPNGWSAKKKGEVDVKKLVSWKGGKNWIETLTVLAQEYSFSAKVDWNNLELTIMPPISGDKIAKVEKNCDSLVVNAAGVQTQVLNKLDCRNYVGPKSWKLNSTMSLRENVEAWAKQSNWNVMWLGVNYPIDFDTLLSGEFADEEGPIAQLAMMYEKAKQPLIFDLKYGNKTLVVKNLDYEQRLFKENMDSIGVQNK